MTIMLTATQSFAQTWEVGGAFNGYFPSDSLWKQQVSGGEFKLAYWPEKSDIGVALNIGQTTWDVEPQTTYQTNVIEDTISGQANYTSLGLSVLTRGELPESPNVLLTLEAGFGYMMGSADMQITSITYNTDPANRFILDTETFSLEGSDGTGIDLHELLNAQHDGQLQGKRKLSILVTRRCLARTGAGALDSRAPRTPSGA